MQTWKDWGPLIFTSVNSRELERDAATLGLSVSAGLEVEWTRKHQRAPQGYKGLQANQLSYIPRLSMSMHTTEWVCFCERATHTKPLSLARGPWSILAN